MPAAPTTPKGPWMHRFLVHLFTVVLAVLIYWLLGFMVDDIGTAPGPEYSKVEERMLDQNLVKRFDGNKRGSVLAVDLTSKQVASTINTEGRPYAIALTRDGARGYVTDVSGQSLFALDTANSSLVKTIHLESMERPTRTPPCSVNLTVHSKPPSKAAPERLALPTYAEPNSVRR